MIEHVMVGVILWIEKGRQLLQDYRHSAYLYTLNGGNPRWWYPRKLRGFERSP